MLRCALLKAAAGWVRGLSKITVYSHDNTQYSGLQRK